MGTVKIGWIPYWNLLPLRKEIDHDLSDRFQIYEDHPIHVNKLLQSKKIHLAPCSSVRLLKDHKFDIALPLGIASHKKVKSVYLGVNGSLCEYFSQLMSERIPVLKNELSDNYEIYNGRPHHAASMFLKSLDKLYPQKRQVPFKIQYSPHSESSVALAKIFFRSICDLPVNRCLQSVAADPGSNEDVVELVIGDIALQRQHEFQMTIDLGSFWYQLTGLNFVFAIWQSHDFQISDTLYKKMLSLGESAEAKMHVDPAQYDVRAFDGNQNPISLASYWKSLRYVLSPNDLQSLMMFLCLAKPFVSNSFNESLIVKMHRWQDKSLSLSEPVL